MAMGETEVPCSQGTSILMGKQGQCRSHQKHKQWADISVNKFQEKNAAGWYHEYAWANCFAVGGQETLWMTIGEQR